MTSPLGLFSVIPSNAAEPKCLRGWTPAAELLAEESSKGSIPGDAVPSPLGRLSTALTHGGRVQTEQLPGAGKAKPSGDSVQTMTVASYPNPTQV